MLTQDQYNDTLERIQDLIQYGLIENSADYCELEKLSLAIEKYERIV